MSPEFKVDWISKDRINALAEKFLREYNPSYSIPVPIEHIVEFDLGMDIIPIPGLKDASRDAGLDIDAFISSDLKSITVDQYITEKRENRYRFTLAHEIAHKILHGDIYEQYRFDSLEDWVATILKIHSTLSQKREREKAEWQADEFAGLILVPKAILEDEYNRERDETTRLYQEDHPEFALYSDIVDYLDFVTGVTIHSLAQKFVVSDDTMRIRLENDGLIERRK